MAFHDIRFPTNVSFGSLGGPERRTEIVELTNGFEERNTPWSQSRRRYDAGLGLRSLDDVANAIAFFEAREGQLHAFRWKDWSDFKSSAPSAAISAEDQLLGDGDEERTDFQLIKSYGDGGGRYERVIAKPVHGTVLVALSGIPQHENVDYTVDYATGLISFNHAPDIRARVTAGFEFDVPVRFDTDRILTSVASFESGQVPDIPVIEVRL